MLHFPTLDWPALLPKFNIDPKFLVNRHGPCPICSAKTQGAKRFRFSNQDNMGTWFCSTCGGGNGLTLLRRFTGESDAAILSKLQKFSGQAPLIHHHDHPHHTHHPNSAPPRLSIPAPLPPEQVAQNRIKLHDAWAAAHVLSGTDPVSRYLARRVPRSQTLTLFPSIRYHPSMSYYEIDDQDKPVFRGLYPVMLAKVVDAQGNTITLHRTYLTPGGSKAPVDEPKKLMSGIRRLYGERIPLVKSDSRTIALAEGIETALAVAAFHQGHINVSAMINCVNLSRVQLPPGRFDRVIIYADRDKIDLHKGYRPGEHWAALSKQKLEAEGHAVEIRVPDIEGTDFCDVWFQSCQ